VLCQQCLGRDEDSIEDFYARTGVHDCVLCGSLGIEALKILGLLILLVLYLVLLTVMVVRDPKRDKDHSVLLRIVTNYFQEILMIKDLNLSWPANITNFFGKFTMVSSTSSALIKINCFFQNYESMEMSTYVIGMIFFSLAPLLFAMLSFIPFGLQRLVKPEKYKATYVRNFVALNMTFIFLIYPTITSYSFGMFNCYEVEEVNYLSVDFSIECWSSEHISLVLKYTLPALLIWVLGFPFTIFYILNRNKASLNEKAVIAKYGLFYIGFNDKSYYWQVLVINLRKSLYIAIAIAVQGYNKNFLVYSTFMVMYLQMSLTRWI